MPNEHTDDGYVYANYDTSVGIFLNGNGKYVS